MAPFALRETATALPGTTPPAGEVRIATASLCGEPFDEPMARPLAFLDPPERVGLDAPSPGFRPELPGVMLATPCAQRLRSPDPEKRPEAGRAACPEGWWPLAADPPALRPPMLGTPEGFVVCRTGRLDVVPGISKQSTRTRQRVRREVERLNSACLWPQRSKSVLPAGALACGVVLGHLQGGRR